jgi:hypothetical protein
MNRAQKAVFATAAGAVALAAGVAITPAASAAPAKSYLVATPGSVNIDYVTSNPATIDLKLDNNCPTAYGTGQDYGIATDSSNPAVATVSPGSVNDKKCANTTQFTLTGLSNGTTTLRFDPVAKNTGLQKKLGGVNVTVTVTNAPTDTNPGDPPPAHKRPAAPAVANAYLDDNNLVAACKVAYADAGHHWHGALLRAVAHWAAVNHLGKAKNDTTLYPTDNSWIRYVQNHVNGLCGYTPV